MSNENGGGMVRVDEKTMQYVPFASKDPIKLSVNIVKDMVSAKTRSGRACSDEDAIKFMMLCKARGLNPFEGDAFLVGYDNKDGSATFSLITAHQAFLKRAEPHPEYDGMESGVIVRDAVGDVVDREGDFTFDDDIILGGWATVHFKNRKFPMRKRLKLSTFAKDNKFWNSNPAGMICKCAEADALRSSFPTILGGMYSAEEMEPPIQIEARTAPAELPIGRSRIGGTRQPKTQEQAAIQETTCDAPPVTKTEDKPAEKLPEPVTPALQQPAGTLFPEGAKQEQAPQSGKTAPDDGHMDDVEASLHNQIEGSVTKSGLAQVGTKMKARLEEFGSAWGERVRLDAAYKAKFKALAK